MAPTRCRFELVGTVARVAVDVTEELVAFALGNERVETRLVVDAVHGVERRILAARLDRNGVDVVGERCREVEALGQEVQILLENDLAHDRRAVGLVVTRTEESLGGVTHAGRRRTPAPLHLAEFVVTERNANGRGDGVLLITCREELGGLRLEIVAGGDRTRLVGVGHVGTDFERQGRRLGERHVDVRAEVVARDVDVGVVIRVGIVVEVTVVAQVACRHVVAGALATAAYVDRNLRVGGEFREELVEPVDIGIEVGIGMGFGHADLLGRIEFAAVGLVVEAHVVGAVEQFGHVHQVRYTALDLHVDGRLLGDTLARGHEHDAVGGTYAVNGRRRCVLEHRDGLDLLDRQVGHRTLHTVHQYQRGARIERRDTADPEFGVVQTRLARTLHDHRTGDLTGQGVREVALRDFQGVA